LALWLATRQRTEQNRIVDRWALIALPQAVLQAMIAELSSDTFATVTGSTMPQ
jgi:hypothetical protein